MDAEMTTKTFWLLLWQDNRLSLDGPYQVEDNARQKGRDLYAKYHGCIIHLAEVDSNGNLKAEILMEEAPATRAKS